MNDTQHKQINPEHAESADSMRDSILRSIHDGKLSRKPRWQFIAQATFTIISVILVLLAAIYLASAVLFALRLNGALLLPRLGIAGLHPFLRSLPWVFVVFTIAFIILLYILVKQFSFAYGRPFLYSALGIVLIVAVASTIIGLTSFHEGVFERARDHRLPFGNSMIYQNFGVQPHDVTLGIVTAIHSSSWQISTREGTVFTVNISQGIPLPQNPKVGDFIAVLGERGDGTINATGIEPLPAPQNSVNQVPPRQMQMPMIPAQ